MSHYNGEVQWGLVERRWPDSERKGLKQRERETVNGNWGEESHTLLPLASGTSAGVVSGKWAASTAIASWGRLTAGLLRASTMTLQVGLGSTWFRNSNTIWRRRLRGSETVAWMLFTSCGFRFSLRPSSKDWFCAGSSSSSTLTASFGVRTSPPVLGAV